MLRVILNRLVNQTEKILGGTSRIQITEECHGTDTQLEAAGGKALGTSEGALS